MVKVQQHGWGRGGIREGELIFHVEGKSDLTTAVKGELGGRGEGGGSNGLTIFLTNRVKW